MSKIIVSAFKQGLPLAANWAQHEELLNVLSEYSGIKQQACGSYKGDQELSVIFEASFLDNARSRIEFIAKLLVTVKQEAALFLKSEVIGYSAYMVTLDGAYCKHELLGKFAKITEVEALASGNFTLVNGEYWGVL
jgi:hypothetical protein